MSHMQEPLRYTGCWPEIEMLKTYPNWVFAADEEGESDQDETTIKPEDQQSFISDETAYTAATAIMPSGSCADAIVSVVEGRIEAVDVWDGRDWWRVLYDSRLRSWTPFVETWLPDGERCASVSLSDARFFPARIVSRLPYCDGPPLETTIPLAIANEALPPRPWYRFW
jgi:hypothetical protein